MAEWMQQNCKIVFISVKDDGDGGGLGNTLSDFTKYLAERFSGNAGST